MDMVKNQKLNMLLNNYQKNKLMHWDNILLIIFKLKD